MEGIGDLESPHMEDRLLEGKQERPREVTNDESEDLVPLECQLNDSEDDVDDGGFQYRRNAQDRVLVSQFETAREDDGSELDDPNYAYSEEELHTDYSSDEENNYRFPTYDAEIEKFNPQLEVGKEFKDIEEFKKAVRHYGVVTRRNLKFTANDEKRAQGVCKKKDCKWKIWASWNKKKGCVQIKTFNPQHTCLRSIHINQDRASQVESQSSRAKLATRRANKNSTNEVQHNSPTDGYIFMPTPGLRVTSDAQSNNTGPSK